MNLVVDRRRRRISLTPMIDVVFLLLVFFMLAARFSIDGAVDVTLAGSGAEYSGPPRLVDVWPDAVRLNGVPQTMDALALDLERLTKSPSDIVVLRPRGEADVQRMIDVMDALKSGGFEALVLVE